MHTPPTTLFENRDVERALLRSLTRRRDTLEQLDLAASDFTDQHYREIFKTLARHIGAGESLDGLLLNEALQKQKSGVPASLVAEIYTEAAEEVDAGALAANYAAMLRGCSQRRWAHSLLTTATVAVLDPASDVHEVLANTGDEITRLATAGGQTSRGPWSAAQPAPDFVNSTEIEPDMLVPNMLAPGAITEMFSPRGVGKTLVAYYHAVQLARRGVRVLLLDRDNPPREIRRRLKAWGAGDPDVRTFKLMTRDEVPPLTAGNAWRSFPSANYDLVIIDSLDASTEGVGEQDSAKPSRALAPLLDIAHRPGGPACWVLGNTIKNAAHARGSGVVEDRADVSFEVRDATDLVPTGAKDWWHELPDGGAGHWADRATRRKRRDRFRIAFIPSKYRIGEEPDPFVVEVDLSGERWTLRDVTDELIAAGMAARDATAREREDKLDAAVHALAQHVSSRAAGGDPVLVGQAVHVLVDRGLKREDARKLIRGLDGTAWRLHSLPGRGNPKALLPVGDEARQKPTAEIDAPPENPRQIWLLDGAISAVPASRDGDKYQCRKPMSHLDFEGEVFPPSSIDADGGNHDAGNA